MPLFRQLEEGAQKIALRGEVQGVDDRLQSIFDTLSGVAGAVIADVQHFIAGLFDNTAHSAKIIGELQTRLALGATFNDTFDRENSPTIGAPQGYLPWTQGGNGQPMGIIGNAARLDNTGGALGVQYAICPVLASTNDTIVATAVNPAGVAIAAATSLFVRANADLTEFVYANIFGKKCYIGRGTRVGNTWTWNDWKMANVGVGEGAYVELIANGYDYSLAINGKTAVSFTDPTYPIDEAHRSVGFASSTVRDLFLIPRYSWGLAAFSHRPVDSKNVNQITKEINAASDNARSAIDEIEKLKSDIGNNTGGSGTNFSHRFVGSGGSLLDPNVWATYDDQIRIEKDTNAAKIRDASNLWWSWARCKTAISSDDVSASVVIGDDEPAANSRDTDLVIRANANLSSFAYCTINGNRVRIGMGSFGAGSGGGSRTQFGPEVGATIRKGHTIEFKVQRIAGFDTYTVIQNGYPILSYTDYSNMVPIGQNNRFVGLIMQRAQALAWMYRSFSISTLSAKDASPNQMVGTGWKLSRFANAAVQTFPTSGHQMCSGSQVTFDRTIYAVGATPWVIGRGIVRCDKSGFYFVRVQFQMESTAGSNYNFRANLWESTDPVTGWNLIEVGPEYSGSPVASCSLETPVYLTEGRYYAPGAYQAGTNGVRGDSLNTVTLFSASLMSR
ncbi:minor tail protein [Rhodococcus phage GuyFagieri]|nr:minor tail protein [Rhodococcus phage GuyFagieri]